MNRFLPLSVLILPIVEHKFCPDLAHGMRGKRQMNHSRELTSMSDHTVARLVLAVRVGLGDVVPSAVEPFQI